MRKAGRNYLLLFYLCMCLGMVFTGCGQSGQKSASDHLESQAQEEVSNTAADSEKKEGDGLQKAEESLDDSGETKEIEETIPENFSVYNYSSMDNVLSALVFAMKQENVSRIYGEPSNDKLINSYIYAYVNLFDQKSFQTEKMKGKNHDTYVKLDKQYLDDLLIYAFGGTISAEDLKEDGDQILKKGDSFYVALGEISSISVDYTGFDNADFTELSVYSFDYEVNKSDGDTEDGIIQVKFREFSKAKSGIVLQTVAISEY